MKNEYINMGETTAILLKIQGFTLLTIVDTNMIDKINEFPNTWFAHTNRNSFYVEGKVGGKHYSIHRWITDAPKGLVVDHKNHNTLDNRLINLAVVTNHENMLNKKLYKKNISGVAGVTWDKVRSKWKARVKFNNVQSYLGLYQTVEEAERAIRNFRETT